jgi:hypothetical protein
MGHQGLEMTRNYVKVYDSKLKSMFDFIEDGDKEEEIKFEPKSKISKGSNSKSSLKRELYELKEMYDEGLISKEIWDGKVEDLLS